MRRNGALLQQPNVETNISNSLSLGQRKKSTGEAAFIDGKEQGMGPSSAPVT